MMLNVNVVNALVKHQDLEVREDSAEVTDKDNVVVKEGLR